MRVGHGVTEGLGDEEGVGRKRWGRNGGQVCRLPNLLLRFNGTVFRSQLHSRPDAQTDDLAYSEREYAMMNISVVSKSDTLRLALDCTTGEHALHFSQQEPEAPAFSKSDTVKLALDCTTG